MVEPLAQSIHIPVLPKEVVGWLRPHDGGRYLDATLGGGGHTAALLAASAPKGRVLAIDADPAARARVAERLHTEIAAGRLVIAAGNFRELGAFATQADFVDIDGVLMDLGLSSDELADRARGFSFTADAPLDMRFDPTTGETAADILATRTAEEIADIIYQYGEERQSRGIARRIVAARERGEAPARTTELARLVAGVVHGRPGGIHPATRTFQALRIAVNGELDALQAALPQALDLLSPGGRIAVISFHSLEDRIVKLWMREEARDCICPPQQPICTCNKVPRLKILTNHPQIADAAELATNPRAASAKLRVAERL